MSAKRPTLIALAGLAVVLALAAAGCGSSTAATGDVGTPGSPGGDSAVSISVSAYKPASITVAAGSTVTWTNMDAVVHTVTADDGSWDSGNMSNGQTFTRTFDAAGTYTYHCIPHPWMKGTVIVTQ